MRNNKLATGIVALVIATAGGGITHPALAQGTQAPSGPVTPQGATSQGMGPGMMGPNMMGQGMMMGPGMMMTPDQMNAMMNMMHQQGMMMGPMMGAGAAAGCCRVQPATYLSANDVKVYFTNWLTSQGNPHLKLGNVTEKNADTITAEIVTQDGSLAQRFAVDRHTGTLQQE